MDVKTIGNARIVPWRGRGGGGGGGGTTYGTRDFLPTEAPACWKFLVEKKGFTVFGNRGPMAGIPWPDSQRLCVNGSGCGGGARRFAFLDLEHEKIGWTCPMDAQVQPDPKHTNKGKSFWVRNMHVGARCSAGMRGKGPTWTKVGPREKQTGSTLLAP